MRLLIFINLIVLALQIALIIAEQKYLGEIDQISTNISTSDNEIQLRIQWNDTIQEDWNYNVIVTPVNLTECMTSPCGEYGIPKVTKEIVLPKELTPYLEHKDCIILPGCSYNIKIESSNGKTSKSKILDIPYCVGDVCSCRHAFDLPRVNMSSEITSNSTITMSWTISLSEQQVLQKTNKTFVQIYEELQLDRIYISISQQTNPSLPWGGKHRPIEERMYPIKENKHSLAVGLIQGNARFKTKQQLYPESRYQIRAHVIDKKRCVGPQAHFTLQMPQQLAEIKKKGYSLSMRIGIVVLSALFVCGIAAFIMIFLRRRKRRKTKNVPTMFPHFGMNISPETMEDNILYVDKDIEDAQAKGLADIFEVPHTALHIGPLIGVGAFGRVFKATGRNLLRMRGTTEVAVKQLKTNPTSEEIQEFLSEISMLKGVGRHLNIVSFLGCCTIRPPYLMIMEFVGRGDLLDYLRTVRRRVSLNQLNQNHTDSHRLKTPSAAANNVQNPVKYIELKIAETSDLSFESGDTSGEINLRPSVSETMYTTLSGRQNSLDEDEEQAFEYILDHTELHNFALQIANGMQFLEGQEIVHRDLAARNVLIDDRKTLKISDFGLSRHGVYTNTKTRRLPLRWLSIEAIRDNIYSNKSDIWAFAVVLWEIGTLGASPYPTISNGELIPYLVSGQRLEKPEICTDQVYELMMQCWHEDPLLRPSFADVYQKLQPKTVYVDISSISDDYVFPPI